MATNLINYETLDEAARIYREKAEEIAALTQTLVNQNGILQEGWQNVTAQTFIERFEDEYHPNLNKTYEALLSISEFISNYVQQQMDQDQSIANGIKL